MNVGSTFSGVGGMDLGLERAGMSVAWQAEIDEWSRRVLEWHWPDAEIFDDVRAVSGDASPVGLLCGGFPCQDLSVAGKRAGLAGERSGLFFEFARIADELRPDWLIVENVVGLLSSSDGRDFGIVLSTLAEIGYGLAWRVLDARFFGVPQRRRRVFIIGRLGDDGSAALRALEAGGGGDLAAGECSWESDSPRTGGRPSVSGPLTRRYGKGVNTTVDDGAVVVSSAFYSTGESQAGFARTDGVSPTLKIGSGFGIASPPAVSFAQNQRGELRETPISAQLTTGGGKLGEGYAAVRADSAVRRLTPTECERLMGWPDGWTAVDGEKTPDTRRYAACGNGVVANVSEWIGRRILAVEAEGNE